MYKLLTIIVPSYNMERYLEKGLTSIVTEDSFLLEQVEVIVVNDGSTDGTSQIAHRFAERYPSVFKVIDKVNGHYGSCINAALPDAQGEYVKVLDADDWFDTTRFAAFLGKLSRVAKGPVKPDLVVSDYSRYFAGQDRYQEVRFDVVDECCCVPFDEKAAREFRDIRTHAVYYRTSILREINYRQTEGVCYTDTQWVTVPFVNVRTYAIIHENVYQYYIGREGQSIVSTGAVKATIASLKIVLDTIAQLNVQLQFHSGAGAEYARIRTVVNLCATYCSNLLRRGERISDVELLKFDDRLRVLSPLFYNCIEERAVVLRRSLNCHYIKLFRKSRSSSTLRFCALRLLLRMAGCIRR